VCSAMHDRDGELVAHMQPCCHAHASASFTRMQCVNYVFDYAQGS
jgi:hypothetical protein